MKQELNTISGHQGDVFFTNYYNISDELADEIFSKSEIVYDVSRNEEGGYTLIEGEETGNGHQIVDMDNVSKIALIGVKDGLKFFLVKITYPTELRHFNVITKQLTKEHNSIKLPAGNWVVNSQREGNLSVAKPVRD